RAARNGVSPELQAAIDQPNSYQLIDRTMPLSFYYGAGSTPERDEAFMRRRGTFYAHCAMVFGFEGWSLDRYKPTETSPDLEDGGRDGRRMELKAIDRTQAVNINTNAAPLEYLVSQEWLQTALDAPGAGNLRWAVALRFREEVAGAQAGGLKSQNLESSGGGFGPRLVSDYALDCMAAVSSVRARLHPGLYRLLEMVVIDDVWVWEVDARSLARRAAKIPVARQAKIRRAQDKLRRRLMKSRRDRIIVKLHKAIDGAAVAMLYMTEQEYAARWIRQRPSSAAAGSR
ncbi:hypothetical protein BZU93_26810, partial [Salmonella enterica subsp. enterica]|nr:hypothetical protein [Salmonella enterica subsp. enterica serovar Enteritidis]